MVDFSAADRAVLQTLQMPDDAKTYYTPVGGRKRKLDDVIFRSPNTPIVGNDLQFEGVGPQFAVHREDVPNLAQGDKFLRASVGYIVTSIDKDEGFMLIAHCRLE